MPTAAQLIEMQKVQIAELETENHELIQRLKMVEGPLWDAQAEIAIRVACAVAGGGHVGNPADSQVEKSAAGLARFANKIAEGILDPKTVKPKRGQS